MLRLNVIWSDGTENETYWDAAEVNLHAIKLSLRRGGHSVVGLEILGYYP